MRRTVSSVLALSALLLPGVSFAQGQTEVSRSVASGGISVAGWAGKIDANEEKGGKTLNDAKLAKDGDAMHVTTGPAVVYWNPANKASGNYTVKATFREPKFMGLKDRKSVV